MNKSLLLYRPFWNIVVFRGILAQACAKNLLFNNLHCTHTCTREVALFFSGAAPPNFERKLRVISYTVTTAVTDQVENSF